MIVWYQKPKIKKKEGQKPKMLIERGTLAYYFVCGGALAEKKIFLGFGECPRGTAVSVYLYKKIFIN